MKGENGCVEGGKDGRFIMFVGKIYLLNMIKFNYDSKSFFSPIESLNRIIHSISIPFSLSTGSGNLEQFP